MIMNIKYVFIALEIIVRVDMKMRFYVKLKHYYENVIKNCSWIKYSIIE